MTSPPRNDDSSRGSHRLAQSSPHTVERLAAVTAGRPRRSASAQLSFEAVSPSTVAATTPSRGVNDTDMSELSRTTPERNPDGSALLSSLGSPNRSALSGSPGDTSTSRPYRSEAIRLRTLLGVCRDELEDAKRQCSGLVKANEAAERELDELSARWNATKQALETQRRETSEHHLAASTLKAERDELEEKVQDAWQRVADLGKALRESEDARRDLEHQLALLSAASSRRAPAANGEQQQQYQQGLHARLECHALREAAKVATRVVDRVQRHMRDALLDAATDTALLSSRADDGDTSAHSAATTTTASTTALLHAADFAMDALKEADVQIEVAVRNQVGNAVRAWTTNTHTRAEENDNSPSASPSVDVVVSTVCADVQPLTQALYAWAQTVQRWCRDRFSVEQHWARGQEALRRLREEKAEWLKEKAWLTHRDAQQLEQLEAERRVGDAPAARRGLAEQLDCVEDWSLIAHSVASLQQRLSDTERNLADADAQKRVLQDKYDQLRARTTGSLETAPALPAATVPNSAVASSTSQELLQLQAQYEEALQYVRDELEPLTAAQAEQLRSRRTEVDALAAERTRLAGALRDAIDTREDALHALVMLSRAYTGLAKDNRELVQQRRALSYRLLVCEPPLEQAQQTRAARGLRRGGVALVKRFRAVVVAVLAVRRLVRLGAASARESWWPHQRIALTDFPQFTHRLRLPVESRVRYAVTGADADARTADTAKPAALSSDVVVQVLARWRQGKPIRQAGTPSSSVADESVDAEEVRLPWLVRALEEAVLVGSPATAPSHITSARPLLVDALRGGLETLAERDDVKPPRVRPAMVPTPQQPPSFYSANNYFTPAGHRDDGDRREEIAPVSAPPCRHVPRAAPVSSAASYQAMPSARKQLFGADTFSGAVPYPAPQLPRTHGHSQQLLPTTATEQALKASIQRDRTSAAYDVSTASSIGGGSPANSLYSVPGNRFANEVLDVIDALDRRVTGALERSART